LSEKYVVIVGIADGPQIGVVVDETFVVAGDTTVTKGRIDVTRVFVWEVGEQERFPSNTFGLQGCKGHCAFPSLSFQVD
jgi:hypothetical protein